jgi:hypothetical protein
MNPQKPITATPAMGTTRAWARLKSLVSPGDKPPLHAPDVDTATWPLPPGRSCVRIARRLTRLQLTDWHFNHHSRSADLLVSALVAKANWPIKQTNCRVLALSPGHYEGKDRWHDHTTRRFAPPCCGLGS